MDYEQLIKDSKGRITREDLELLERACKLCNAETVIEIGSADGGSSVLLATMIKKQGGHLYCIEPKPKQRMVDNMVKYDVADCYTIIAKASPWVPFNKVPGEVDLLFIDGCHELRWCLADYHYWAPKVKVGGIIVFHDYGGQCAEDRRRPGFGKAGYVGLVKRAVDIILETDEIYEIDRSKSLNGGAIAFRK